MITRAQAEALLTLAESLEACERQEIKFMIAVAGKSESVLDAGFYHTAIQLRLAVNALIPKQET